MANKVLMALKEHPSSWTRVDVILEQSTSAPTRFFGLQILEETVRFRWKALPTEQSEGIKNYIVNKIIALSSEEASLSAERVFIGKMNLILVHILKQEWPHNWPGFIPELVGASKTSEVLCENNMSILKLLSEEVFEFSKDSMTTEKVATMKESLTTEFANIFDLCQFILEHSQKPQLLVVTLQTLLRFLQWIPLRFVFETGLIDALLSKFLPVPAFRNDTIRCLTEISTIAINAAEVGAKYNPVFQQLYGRFMQQMVTLLPPGANIPAAFESGTDTDEQFIQALALFFTGFFKSHLPLLETAELQVPLMQGMEYLVEISKVDDDQIFKICLEYYHCLSEELYKADCQFATAGGALALGAGFGGGGGAAAAAAGASGRKAAYRGVFTRVRQVMISKMVKPEEVLIVEDENGEIIREQQKDTEVLAQYKTMREALVFLTHLDYEDTENHMLEKLALQVDGTEWSWNNLNTLCWAIGSISGAMNEEEEKRFLVTVIKDLLGLCEMKRGKDNKAVIASNIMYVVGQYTRFLRAHWKFLKTVVNKLFEFMHELHPGVQDMACDTFLKIAQKFKRKFVTPQTGERMTFIEELLASLDVIVSDLESHQIHTFYEAVGCMLSAHGEAGKRDELLTQLMGLPNGAWRDIMANASARMDSLMEQPTIREVIKILKTNSCCCQSVGVGFISQLGTIYLDMLNVYKAYSEHISAAVAAQGVMATRTSQIRAMRAAKKDVLRLIEVFIGKFGERDDPKVIASNFIPPLLDPVLGDYHRNIPEAREPEVLSLMAAVVTGLKSDVIHEVPRIFADVFECTLQMITQNFEDFPEHRINFFKLIQAVNSHCFPALFAIPAEHQKYVVDSVVWALKHTERNIADTGLDILLQLLKNVEQAPAVAQGFYSEYFLSLLQVRFPGFPARVPAPPARLPACPSACAPACLPPQPIISDCVVLTHLPCCLLAAAQDVFAVLTDRLHKSGFKMHASILQHMFRIVQHGQVTAPLWAKVEGFQPPAGLTNQVSARKP